MIESSYSMPPTSPSPALRILPDRRPFTTVSARVPDIGPDIDPDIDPDIVRTLLPFIALAIVLTTLAGLAWPRPAGGAQAPAGYDPQAAVERTAREHLQALSDAAGLRSVSVDVTAIPRDTLRPCARQLQVEDQDTRHLARMRFSAVCNDSAPWRLEFIVRGSIEADVVTAARDLRAGTPIAADALTTQRRELVALDAATSDATLVSGKASRRALRSGQMVNLQWLVEPLLVRHGAAVDIVARNPGIAVRVAGEALEAGRRWEVIEVRNVANGRVIRARVIAAHTVEPVGKDDTTLVSPP